MYSCDLVHLSLTLSGIGLGLCHIISCLRYHPSARNANANIHGIPIKSFSLSPCSLLPLLAHLSGKSCLVLLTLCFGNACPLPGL